MSYLIPVHSKLTPILSGIALAMSLALPVQASDDYIQVFMNNARILKLDRPISKVIIGNSNVADVTISDSKTIVLTGKTYGSTNLVILDGKGNAIVDERILVSVDETNTVRLYKNTERSVYSCSPSCEKNTDSVVVSSGAPGGAPASMGQ